MSNHFLVYLVTLFVTGQRRPRKEPVSKKQIVRHLTPFRQESEVEEAITDACAACLIRCCAKNLSSHRRANGAYVYEAEPWAMAVLDHARSDAVNGRAWDDDPAACQCEQCSKARREHCALRGFVNFGDVGEDTPPSPIFDTQGQS